MKQTVLLTTIVCFSLTTGLGHPTGVTTDPPATQGVEPFPEDSQNSIPSWHRMGPNELEPWEMHPINYVRKTASPAWQDWWVTVEARYLQPTPRPNASGCRWGPVLPDWQHLRATYEARARAVEFLTALLERKRDPLLGPAAFSLALLAESRDSQREGITKLLVSLAAHPDPEVRPLVAIALGILATPDAERALLELLDPGKPRFHDAGFEPAGADRTRCFALLALGIAGTVIGDGQRSEEIVRVLWRFCEDLDGYGRNTQAAAVIAMGLVPLDDTEPPDGREARPPDAPPSSLEEQLRYLVGFATSYEDKSRPYLVRAHAPISAARLLGRSRADRLKELLVRGLGFMVTKRGNIGNRELRRSSAIAFGGIGRLGEDPLDVAIREHLMGAIENADRRVQKVSAFALAEIVGHPGGGADPLAGEDEIRDVLLSRFSGPRRVGRSRRPWAALALGAMEREVVYRNGEPSGESLEALWSALEEPEDPYVVSALLIACGLAGDLDQDTGMESPLVDLLRSRRLAEHDDGTVGSAALALGLAGALGARDAIREVATNPWLGEASWRSVAIASTLLWDGDPSRWKLEEGAELSPELWSALAAAHGFRRDEKAARFLGEVIADPSHPDRVRLQATLALCWSRTWVRDSLFADMNREAHVPVLLTETERFMLDLPWYPWVW